MVVIDKAGTWAFFANRDSNTVSFMDLNDYRIVANVPVGRGGEGIALSPDEKEIWVGDRAEATMTGTKARPRATLLKPATARPPTSPRASM
jgi:DNA-binding beta-propeller fold protein YncE